MPEKEFFAKLHQEGFEPTDFVDGDLRIWSYKGQAYTIPQTIAENSEQGFYCRHAVEKFFGHVFLEEALEDPCDARSYNVEKLKPRH